VIFSETQLAGAFVIELEPKHDERGFFARAFCERELAAHGLGSSFPQCNISYNRLAGTLRGMHFNSALQPEAKLVRCIRGAVHDVIVDLRPSSPTRMKSIAVELSAENRRMLYVPEGFAHGFLTLDADTEVYYHMGAFFVAEAARGFRYDDPAFAIDWPRRPQVISERDASYAAWAETD
jgi:dTDP-4-dehydrorhamnose 3,5-epimerase